MPVDSEKIVVYDNYFYAYKTVSSKKRRRFKPESITLYWDASLSMENRDLEKELNLLESYFSDVKNIDVTFIAFSNTVLKNKSFKERPLFWHLASRYRNPPCSVIRKGKWKLIQFLNDGKVELYNLEEDLKESQNLIDKNPEKGSELLVELVTWRKNNKVPLPKSSILEF